jgi:hypothetical protein
MEVNKMQYIIFVDIPDEKLYQNLFKKAIEDVKGFSNEFEMYGCVEKKS